METSINPTTERTECTVDPVPVYNTCSWWSAGKALMHKTSKIALDENKNSTNSTNSTNSKIELRKQMILNGAHLILVNHNRRGFPDCEVCALSGKFCDTQVCSWYIVYIHSKKYEQNPILQFHEEFHEETKKF